MPLEEKVNALIPSGFQMWWRDDGREEVKLFGLSRSELCEMKTFGDYSEYRIRDYLRRLSDSEDVWTPIPHHNPAVDGKAQNKACFRANESLFVVNRFDHYGISQILEQGPSKHSRREFFIGDYLMAYDYITQLLYLYKEGIVYQTTPFDFFDQLDEVVWNTVSFPNIWLQVDEKDWADFFVISGHLFYIRKKHIYRFVDGKPEKLAPANNDFFDYLLVPRYEDISFYNTSTLAMTTTTRADLEPIVRPAYNHQPNPKSPPTSIIPPVSYHPKSYQIPTKLDKVYKPVVVSSRAPDRRCPNMTLPQVVSTTPSTLLIVIIFTIYILLCICIAVAIWKQRQ